MMSAHIVEVLLFALLQLKALADAKKHSLWALFIFKLLRGSNQ